MRTKDRAAVKTAGSIPLSNYSALENANRKSIRESRLMYESFISLFLYLISLQQDGCLLFSHQDVHSFSLNERMDKLMDRWTDR